jgi:hypothetical protein
MVACVGLCYTQRLWQRLRGDLLEVGVVEELFQIRANAIRLLKPSVLRYAPTLFSIAMISWLLPIAMIYPPGALVVGLEYLHVPEQFNVSVIPREGTILPATAQVNGDEEFDMCSIGFMDVRQDNCREPASDTRVEFRYDLRVSYTVTTLTLPSEELVRGSSLLPILSWFRRTFLT